MKTSLGNILKSCLDGGRKGKKEEGKRVGIEREGGKERRDWALTKQVQVNRQKLPRKGRSKGC